MSTIRVVNLQHTDATEPNIVLLEDGTSVFASGITISGGTNLTVSGTAEFASGTVSAPGVTFIDDNNTGLYSPATDTVAITTSGTEHLRVDSSGRVGIGTSSPSSVLNVVAQSDTVGGAGITLGNTVGNRKWLTRFGTNTDLGLYYDFWDGSSWANKFTLTYTGNVGIGTTSPDGLLTVRPSSGNSQIFVRTNDTTSRSQLLFGDSADNNVGGVQYDHSDNSMQFHLANTGEKVRIDSSGNVGIGTTSPGSGLHLNKENPTITLQPTDDTQHSFIDFRNAANNNSRGFIGYNLADDYMNFRTNGSGERMRIDSAGRVGIGVSNPGSFDSGAKNLVVGTGSGVNGISIYGGVTSASNIYFADGTSGNQKYAGTISYNHNIDSLIFGTNGGTERMRISGAGVISLTQNQARFQLSTQNGLAIPISIQNTGNNTSAILQQFTGWNGTVIGSISGYVNQTTYATSSDYRLKENITSLIDGISRVKQLQPKRFNFIENPDLTLDGFFAHEAQQVVPNAVTGEHDEIDQESKPVYQGIDHSKLVPLLTAALQEAIAKIETLEQRLSDAGIA